MTLGQNGEENVAKLVIKTKASPTRKALAKMVTVENTDDGKKVTGTKKQVKAWAIEEIRKGLKPK